MREAEVNGSSFRGALKYVKESDYPGGIPRFVERLPEEDRPGFSDPFLPGAWYPYGTYAALLRHLERELGDGNGDRIRRFGRFSAAQDASTALKIVRIFTSIGRLAPKAHTFWPRHCRNAGEFRPVEVGDDFTRTALAGFPDIHPLHCRVLQGWFEGMCLEMGADEARTGHPRCVHRGDEECEFDVRWTA